jgi:hypothetical protein
MTEERLSYSLLVIGFSSLVSDFGTADLTGLIEEDFFLDYEK